MIETIFANLFEVWHLFCIALSRKVSLFDISPEANCWHYLHVSLVSTKDCRIANSERKKIFLTEYRLMLTHPSVI